MPKLREADALAKCGRQQPGFRKREALLSPARSKTLARKDALCTGTGRSRVRPRRSRNRAASGSLRTGAYDERTWEVGQTHSTGEVPEQSQTDGGGGDGGKGSGQREPGTSKNNAFRTQSRGRRAEQAGARTRKGRR